MSKPVLTTDQRWLLLHMGTWQIVHALCSPEGVTALMTSRWGSTGGRLTDLNDAPEWLKTCGWEISGGVIHARTRKLPGLKIKAAEINRFAAQLPDDIKAELIDCRNAGTANAVLRGRFCHCGNHQESYPWQKNAICPATMEQENQAAADYWRINAWQHVVLAKALGLNGCSGNTPENEESEQLQLFGVAS